MSNNQISTNILMKKSRLLKTALILLKSKTHISYNGYNFKLTRSTEMKKDTKYFIQFILLYNRRMRIIKMYPLKDFELNEQLTKCNL